MTESPHVTIAIVNWNGKSLLQTCLETISAHTEYPSYRIVVVDNGSTDGSVEMLSEEFPHVDIVENSTNRGFAAANNQVFDQFLETDYYLLLNNDIEILNDGWLQRFVDVAERTGAGITGCRLVYPDGTLEHGGAILQPGWGPARNINEGNIKKYGHEDSEEREPDYVSGAAFLVSEEVIDDVGGFNKRYSPAYYEEIDLSVRAKAKGYKIVYTPEVELIHRKGQTSDENPEFMFKNQLQFVLIHFPLSWLLKQLVYELRGLLGHIYHRRSLRKIYDPIIAQLPEIISERKNANTRKVLKHSYRTTP